MKIQGLLELRFSSSHPEVVASKTNEDGYCKTYRLNTNDVGFFYFFKTMIQECLDEGYRVEWVKE